MCWGSCWWVLHFTPYYFRDTDVYNSLSEVANVINERLGKNRCEKEDTICDLLIREMHTEATKQARLLLKKSTKEAEQYINELLAQDSLSPSSK